MFISAQLPRRQVIAALGRSGEVFPRDSSTCFQTIKPSFPIISTSFRFHGVTQLDLNSHPLSCLQPKTTGMSLQLPRSDQPVYFTAEVGSVGPSAIASAVAEPLFPHSWNSPLPIPPGYDHF